MQFDGIESIFCLLKTEGITRGGCPVLTHNGTHTRTAGCMAPCAIGGIECDFTEVEIKFILGHKTGGCIRPVLTL